MCVCVCFVSILIFTSITKIVQVISAFINDTQDLLYTRLLHTMLSICIHNVNYSENLILIFLFARRTLSMSETPLWDRPSQELASLPLISSCVEQDIRLNPQTRRPKI